MARRLVGMDNLMRKYEQLAESVTGQALERAVGASAKRVQAGAKLLCPVHFGELRQSIRTMTEVQEDKTIGVVYTNKEYAMYVEFGTGPVGEDNHVGISPAVTPSYSQSPWWIHESQVDAKDAETYGWFYLDTPKGRFYRCYGQPAQPFMYPALKDNEDSVTENISKYLAREIRKACK